MVEEQNEELNPAESAAGADAGSALPRTDEPSRRGDEGPQLPPVPEKLVLSELQELPLARLYEMGERFGLRVGGARSKHQLIFEILTYCGRRGTAIEAEGIVEIAREGFGLIRNPKFNFAPLPDDIFISPSVVRRFSLRPGQYLQVTGRPPRDQRDKYVSVELIVTIEGVPVNEFQQPVPFDKLTPLFPTERIILENLKTKSPGPRVVDIVAPMGKGQRGLICAPPRGGKTILLKEIATSICENHKEIELIVLLLDERPEEVTDFRENVPCQVFASTFDESAARHIQVAELVMERARRLVEAKKDVVILLDSLTRLARGYNNMLGGKGGLMSGGMNPVALQRVRKFFGSARKVEEGGSLTLLATALIETDSRMDMVIFEEFKGTGNMEIHLDREMVERRIYPAIHLQKTGTRKDDLLYHPDEFRRITAIRRQLAQLPPGEAMEVLLSNIKASGSNAELLLTGLRQ